MAGADSLLKKISAKLGISPGGTTPDGLFTLSTVECLASCGTAPVMAVNGRYYENLNWEKAEKLLEDLKNGKLNP